MPNFVFGKFLAHPALRGRSSCGGGGGEGLHGYKSCLDMLEFTLVLSLKDFLHVFLLLPSHVCI